jgi:hypothetical protein
MENARRLSKGAFASKSRVYLWMSIPSVAIGRWTFTGGAPERWGAGLLELNHMPNTRLRFPQIRGYYGLSATILGTRGRLEENPSALTRVSVPPRIAPADTRSWLRSTRQSSVVEGWTKGRSAAAHGADDPGYRAIFIKSVFCRRDASSALQYRTRPDGTPPWMGHRSSDYALRSCVPAGQH